jgi:EAL domain-containing protein (putative c-di-GMP-specific phosphodiesterase class I)
VLAADQFIELAEQTGLMASLTETVLRQAVRQLAGWRAQGHDLKVAVNLSVSNLFDSELPRMVADVLRAASVPAPSLILEITEHGLMFDRDAAGGVLDQLRALGCDLSVDDYGTGFSALSYLRDLPVTEIKLDRSFLVDATFDARAQSIVHSTVNLAHGLGMRMVAEGVETAADLALLTRLGCDQAQGYFIARPMPAADLTAMLESSRSPAA